MNNCIKLLLLVLLVKPVSGLGQQAPASRFESLVAAAKQAHAIHDYAAAVNDYKQAVRIEPNMPELWANLGLMQREAGDVSEAFISFQHANRLNPSLYVPNLFLGIETLRSGRAKEAVPFLLKAEKTNKADPQAPLALGRAYFKSGKYSSAAEALDRATVLDPKLGSAWFTLGIAHLDQVEADARKMSEDGKQSPFAGALYAESLHKQARFGEAASLYKSLIDSQLQPPCLRSELGFSLLREHDPVGAASEFSAERAEHPECGLAFLGQARLAMDSGDKEQAGKLLKELWERDHGFVESNAAILLEGMPHGKAQVVVTLFAAPDSTLLPSDLRDALQTAFILSGEDSIDTISGQASGADPVAVPALDTHRTAEEYYAKGHFSQCVGKLEPSLATLGANKLRLLAACAFFTANDHLAVRAANALEAMQPDSLEALYWSIQANERLAFKALARFQQLEPDSAKNHVLLGDIYKQLERFDDAQIEYLSALAIAPKDPAAMLGLASVYLSNNNIDEAGETAQSSLVRSPEDPELNLIMGQVMLSHNKYAEAEPYLAKSLNVKPQMLPHVHALIGKAYAETGRTREAIDQLKMGASSDEDGAIQYLLARLYRKLGDNQEASEALDRMKVIKQQRRDRGVKRVEDPDLSSLETRDRQSSAP